ncbi:hypothetical protein QE404_001154 [Chryseobacterium camelliae]|uniref:Uridine phosphorylase n=1 Tax=Chryseobacterium camelliae TaxID=1265445 RepID=A0ABU0TG13_9FLAO|nr:hypothetical protein [Chryseobacterium camelliae]
MLNKLAASELVLNDDGSVYHLNLLPEDIAEKIILVGDPDRVAKVSAYFDSVEIRKNKREFYTHTRDPEGRKDYSNVHRYRNREYRHCNERTGRSGEHRS